jgi:hypothetical protein
VRSFITALGLCGCDQRFGISSVTSPSDAKLVDDGGGGAAGWSSGSET